MIDEDEFYTRLLKELENKRIFVNTRYIKVIPNFKNRDSPDFVLELSLSLNVVNQELEIKLNLPIELEKTGLHEALLDLNKFVTRENFINDLPMLIISGSEFQNVDRSFPLETHFVIKEIPERSL